MTQPTSFVLVLLSRIYQKKQRIMLCYTNWKAGLFPITCLLVCGLGVLLLPGEVVHLGGRLLAGVDGPIRGTVVAVDGGGPRRNHRPRWYRGQGCRGGGGCGGTRRQQPCGFCVWRKGIHVNYKYSIISVI